MPTFDLSVTPLRDLNQALHAIAEGSNETAFEVVNPRGSHAVAVGIDKPVSVDVRGSVGYYCAGMNDGGTVTVHGSAGPGVAENMMSGTVVIEGDASQYAGATGRGGLLVIKGNAASRCGISMKGIDIVVCGSIYEAKLFVRGSVKSLGADCIEKEMKPKHLKLLAELLDKAGVTDAKPEDFKRYGSARTLYNFNIDNADAY